MKLEASARPGVTFADSDGIDSATIAPRALLSTKSQDSATTALGLVRRFAEAWPDFGAIGQQLVDQLP